MQSDTRSPPEVTVLYPCLNEEKAIGDSVDGALKALAAAGLHGEVLVVDNASTDRSAEIAREKGARVILESRRGYGSAYLKGLAEARGDYIVMLDADGTYPVEMVGEFVEHLRQGAHFVCGNRFTGKMDDDAMPFVNRYVGNPVLSSLTRLLFNVRLKDIHCGMRAVRRAALPQLQLQTLGMEFATEMIVKALDADLKVVETGIPYRARIGVSKLVSLRDGWRHVEYMLVFSPIVILVLPGIALAFLGYTVQLMLLAGPIEFFSRSWSAHTSLAGLATVLTGSTFVSLGFIGANYAWTTGLRFRHSRLARRLAELEDYPLRLAGLSLATAGAVAWGWILAGWAGSGFGALSALPQVAFATSLLAPGIELMGAAMLVHLVRIPKS